MTTDRLLEGQPEHLRDIAAVLYELDECLKAVQLRAVECSSVSLASRDEARQAFVNISNDIGLICRKRLYFALDLLRASPNAGGARAN